MPPRGNKPFYLPSYGEIDDLLIQNPNQPAPADTIIKQFYAYEFESLGLAAAGTSIDTINIQADSDFVWQKTSFQADIAGIAQTEGGRIIPNATLQFQDTGSGRNFFDNPIPVTSVAGWGELPFILPVAAILRKNTNLICEFVSFEATITLELRISLIGYKIFRPGP